MSVRYVVVRTEGKKVVGGPYMWDGHTKWTAPEIASANEPDHGLEVMTEDDALAAGFKPPKTNHDDKDDKGSK